MSVSLCNLVKKIRFTGTQSEQKHKFLLLITLACFCNEDRSDGLCWPAIATLVMRSRMSRRSVFKYLNELESEGFLRREARAHRNGRQTTSFYFLDIELIHYYATEPLYSDTKPPKDDYTIRDEHIDIDQKIDELEKNYRENPVEERGLLVDNTHHIVHAAHPSKENNNININPIRFVNRPSVDKFPPGGAIFNGIDEKLFNSDLKPISAYIRHMKALLEVRVT